MDKKKLSIKQIAQLADVSSATVSRVINQKGGYGPETESRVLDVIKENNYVPNQIAKGLRTNMTNVIGLIVPDIVNEYFAKMVLNIQMELFEQGYLTMVCNVNETDTLEYELIKALIAQNICGLILISGRENTAMLNNIPTIYVDRWPKDNMLHDNMIVVESDNKLGGYIATKELIDCGCKKIAFVTDSIGEGSKIDRYEGHSRAMIESNINLDLKLKIQVKNVTVEDAYSEVILKIEEGVDIDGIVCSTDILAIGTILALKEKGYKVPEDVKVTGFDDISMANLFEPSITTVHQYYDKAAKRVSELLTDLIEGNLITNKKEIIPVKLIRRKSTKAI